MTTEIQTAWQRAEIERFLACAPIYCQPWWLEALSPGNWDYAVVSRGSEIAAVLPFVRQKCGWGQVALRMPEMTHTLGPWLRLSETEYSKQMEEQTELMARLIDALPPHVQFQQDFHYTVTSWLPFCWRGFSQTTGYTYVFQDLDDLDAIWEGFDHDVRTNIHKAQKIVRVVDDLDIETFNDVRIKSFARQGRTSVWPLEFIRRVDTACKSHNARKIFFAIDSTNRIHCVVYMVWTEYAAYLIMGGGDPALRTSGANYLLIWEAIQFAHNVARSLDFEMGAPTEPIEHFFRLFGARLVPYYRVTRDRRGPCSKAWSVFRRLLGRRHHRERASGPKESEVGP
jgi:hypothetical protein